MKGVWQVFYRELRDQLRDRRTLFMAVVLPVLLYPALGLGALQMALLYREKPRTVVLLGSGNLPAEPPLLENGTFAPRWFDLPTDAGRLQLVTDAPPAPGEPAHGRREELLDAARRVWESYQAEGGTAAGQAFDLAELEAVIVVPEGFGARLDQVRARLRQPGAGVNPPAETSSQPPAQASQSTSGEGVDERPHPDATISPPVAEPGAEWPRVRIVYNKARDQSVSAWSRSANVLENWQGAVLAGLLADGRLDKQFAQPAIGPDVDLSIPAEVSANQFTRLVPLVLVLMSLTGAFYPAIDLVAGERERGTMETLLILPISRLQIVLGKFAAVLCFSLVTALLNLLSVGFTSRQIVSSIPGREQATALAMTLPGPGSVALLVALLLPVAGLFSALSLALSCFARSNKEGQYYLSPLLMVGMGLGFYCLSPGVELSPQLAILPIIGPSLMMKTLLSGPTGFEAVRGYLPSVLLSSLLYTGLAVWWACELFKGEAVLFRDSDRFEPRAWLRQQWRTRGWHATLSQAVAGFAVLMLLRFFGIVGATAPSSDLSATERGMSLLRQTAGQQVWLLGLPALVLAGLCLRRPAVGLRWCWPGWKSLAAGALLAVGLFPLLVWLQHRLSWFFANTPETARDLGQALLDPAVPLWQVIGTIVLAPAICEELAFRGLLLDGLSSQGRAWRGVIISALMFGASHMIPQQVFNATLLGLALGWLTLRTGSLLPAMVMHACNNALAILFARLTTLTSDSKIAGWLLQTDVSGPGPTLPLLCAAIACCAGGYFWLSRLPGPVAAPEEPSTQPNP